MTHSSIIRQQELERRQRLQRLERLERDRQWANAVRADDMLAAHQRATYYEKVQKLIALNRLINGE